MSTELPLVTVVLPAMNHEQFVEQALDSILGSGLPSLELVVCDDASSDATAGIIARWGARHGAALARFEFIAHRRNVGLSASLNEIVRAARGEIIHILASDDCFLPGGLAAKTAAMLQHPEWEGAFCDAQGIGPAGQIYQDSLMAFNAIEPERLVPALMPEELLYNWNMPANILSWRRRAYKAFGGGLEYDSTVFCEDYDSVWWALGRRSLGFVPAICYGYRLRSWPQTSDRNPIREHRDVSYVLTKHARHFAPWVQEGMAHLSAAHLHTAIGDLEAAGRCWQQHGQDRDRYLERVRRPEAVPVAEPDVAAIAAQSAAEMAAQYAALQQRSDQQEQLIAAQAAEIERTQQLLTHHSASPLRALDLWFKRRSRTGG